MLKIWLKFHRNLLLKFKFHWGLMMPYGDRDLGQHWLRQWLVAWRHQAITWTNVDLSSVRFSYSNHQRVIPQGKTWSSITEISLKISNLNFDSNFPGANELMNKSTLVEVMALYHQATSHYLKQCWHISVMPYAVTGPYWADEVNSMSVDALNAHSVRLPVPPFTNIN